ncbi:hypothetical protein T10_5050 [Trichinella papuae]|uniref:Uncharacterized protein n=1 Tax=Trichinella papuae TaxID=268474 RepID=A0A0V1M0A6_9BILA|nr:hypothetical protein T10_5050 [Trichinella papuae]
MNECESAVAPEQKLLGGFVQDIPGLLRFLKKTNGVIVGSAVLHALMGRPSGVVSDLHIVFTYVTGEELSSSLLHYENYFMSQGYLAVPFSKRDVSQTEQSEYLQVPEVSLLFNRQSDGKTIYVRTEVSAESFSPLFEVAWATHMYTFATHEAIYCMFPRLTVEKQQSVIFARHIANDKERVGYYRKCGFTFISPIGVDETPEYCSRRNVNDEYTLRVPFSFSVGGKFVSDYVVRIDNDRSSLVWK